MKPDAQSRLNRPSNGWISEGCGGMVVSAFPDATDIGAAILMAGGNAVDAACATAWALAVCEPAESGLGGQTTALVHDPTGAVVEINGISHAPRLACRATVTRAQQQQGRTSTTVPSTVMTLAHMQRRFGVLTLAEVLEPAIHLAQVGHRVTRLQRKQIKWTREALARCKSASEIFLSAGGAIPEVGVHVLQPALARTLARISEQGAGEFYLGETAEMIVRDMQSQGGLIDREDLAAVVAPVERKPLEITWKGRRVLSTQPSGGGVQVLLALKCLESLAADDTRNTDDPTTRARTRARVLRAVFQERKRWPDHPDDLNKSIARWVVSAERAACLVKKLDHVEKEGVCADIPGEAGNTTHLCVADSAGWVVSLTQSIQSVFGAKVMCGEAGFFYNNYLKTCPRRAHPYRLEPGATPQSNAAPTIVLEQTDGGWRPALAIGAAGSRRITSSIVQIITEHFERGVALPEALRAPRMHALLSGKLWVEKPMLRSIDVDALQSDFDPIRVLSKHAYKAGAVQAIGMNSDGVMIGVADPRRDGSAATVSTRLYG